MVLFFLLYSVHLTLASFYPTSTTVHDRIVATTTLLSISCVFCFRMLVVSNSLDTTIQFSQSVLLILTVVTFNFYMKCALGDPGLLRQDYEYHSDAKLGYLCAECGMQKSREHHHCFDCRCCTYRRENHCAWIGKCVGSKTSADFKIFNVCWSLYICFIIYIFIVKSVFIANSKEKANDNAHS